MLDHRIQTFLTLCNTLSYTKAAKELCITQPAVTQHIKYLEKYYQCRLFVYEGKQLMLTSKGEQLRKMATVMKSNEQKIYNQISYQQEGLCHIKLGATKSIADYLVPNAVTNYMLTDRKRTVDLISDNTENLLNQLHTGEIDIAMIEGKFNKKDYRYEVIREEPFICIAAADFNYDVPLQIEDLFSERIIVREPGSGTRSILEEYLRLDSYDLNCFRTKMEIDNFMSVKAMVKAGLGISFVYRLVVEQELHEGTIISVPLQDMPIIRPFYFVYSKESMFQEEYHSFIQEFRHAQREKNSV